METRGGPPLLTRLAVAFGEGLAFSAGMVVADDIRRRAAAATTGPAADAAPIGDRLQRLEDRLGNTRPAAAPASNMDMRAVYAIVEAVEKHLDAHATKVAERIDGLQAIVTASADAAAAERVAKEVAAVREDVRTMQRETLDSIAHIAAAQAEAEVARRTAAIEASIRDIVEAAVAPVRAEVLELRGRTAEAGGAVPITARPRSRRNPR